MDGCRASDFFSSLARFLFLVTFTLAFTRGSSRLLNMPLCTWLLQLQCKLTQMHNAFTHTHIYIQTHTHTHSCYSLPFKTMQSRCSDILSVPPFLMPSGHPCPPRRSNVIDMADQACPKDTRLFKRITAKKEKHNQQQSELPTHTQTHAHTHTHIRD